MARGGLRAIEKRWKRAAGSSWGTNSTKLARWLNLVHGDLAALLRVAKAARKLVDLLGPAFEEYGPYDTEIKKATEALGKALDDLIERPTE